jgi:hypothetical protein
VTWARHTRDDILRALMAMMDLVADLAQEITAAYGFGAPGDAESSARVWVRAVSAG